MKVQVLNAVPARYGTYTKEGDTRDPIAWGDGSLVEYVDVLDNEGQSTRMTLAQSVNGTRQPEGVLSDLVVLISQKQEVVFNRDGRERILTRHKFRVLEMTAAPVGSGKQAA